jgi:hypothetical protein
MNFYEYGDQRNDDMFEWEDAVHQAASVPHVEQIGPLPYRTSLKIAELQEIKNILSHI